MTAATTRAATALAAAGLAWGATGVEAQAETAVWINPAGGDWNDPANWLNGDGPLAHEGDSVLFDLDAAYVVQGPRFFDGRRLHVAQGDVTLLEHPDPGSIQGLHFRETEPLNPPALLIGSFSGRPASLTTDASLSATQAVIGVGGEGILTTDRQFRVDDLAVGGVGDRMTAVGELALIGPDARLGGQSQSQNIRTTLGLTGAGRLRMEDGATAGVEQLRLAVDPGARADIALRGAGTRLEAQQISVGPGASTITVEAGATLALPQEDRIFFNVEEGQVTRFVFDGGALEGGAGLAMNREHFRDGDITLAAHAGSDLEFTGEIVMQNITLDGAGTRIAAPGLFSGGEVQIRDGAELRISQSTGATSTHSFNIIGGDVTLDGASLVVEDDAEISRRPSTTGIGSVESAGALMMRNGAVIEAEGGLSVVVIRSSVIEGASSVMQRLQTFKDGVFGNEESTEGHLLLVGIGHPDPPSLTIRGGSIVQGSFIKSGVSIFAESEGTSLAADERMEVASGTFTVRDGAKADSPVIVVRKHGSDGAVLQGDGLLVGSVSNEGVLDPGEQSAPGVLRIQGRVIQRAHSIPPVETVSNSLDSPQQRHLESGELRIDIAGREPGEHDRLEVSGAAILGGTLRATLAEGFEPRWGDRFVFLTAGAIDPGFETLEAPPAPPGLVWEVEFTDATAALALHRTADLTRDLTVDAQDLGVLLGEWGLPDSPADLNADGVVDGADLGSLLGQWGLRAN